VPADQMLLDDPLEHGRSRRVIPDALRIHHRDRPPLADPRAVGLGAIHAIAEPQFREPLLQIRPGLCPALLRAALRFGLLGAQKNVTPRGSDPLLGRDLFETLVMSHYPTTAAGLLSSPIPDTEIVTTSPAASA